MEWPKEKDFKTLSEKYKCKTGLLAIYKNISDQLRHEIYSTINSPDSPNDKAEVNGRLKYEDGIVDILNELGTRMDNIYDAIDELNDAMNKLDETIDACDKITPYNEKDIQTIENYKNSKTS